MTQLLLELINVSKTFGKKIIYDNLSFSFSTGSYAIVGPNGTGKTVLIEMLAGVTLQNVGLIQLKGFGDNQSYQYKQKLTYVPAFPSFFPDATGNDFINFIYSIKKCEKNNALVNLLIEKFNLIPQLDKKFKNMSLGTQKKLFLVTLAIGDSDLIVMDEPTNALDNESCQLLNGLIKKISQEKIIIIATHSDQFLHEIDPVVLNITTHPITNLT